MPANPLLPGTYPDPSICRVGDDYYLVTSTFEYFPGLPVFHSRDLVSWRQLGHAIDRADQLDLSHVPSSGGLFAPTLRHHDGVFYLVNTLVHAGEGVQGGNFLLTAVDPAGPWSDPVWLTDAEGIDPSLFFDDDGRVWFTATRPTSEPAWPGQTDVWLRELDLAAQRLVGPEHVLWHGALLGAVWAEGPHVYKVDGRYYLLAAEGGTEQNHAVSVARADAVTGPYTPNPANPVLTHRNLGRDVPIVGTGHADLVQLPSGAWWAVLLAMRPYGGYHYNLGRETFGVPVVWADGWPVFAPGDGRVRESVVAPAPAPAPCPWPEPEVRDDFDLPELDLRWNAVRGPAASFASPGAGVGAGAGGGGLRLRLLPQTLADAGTPAFLGRRQQHRDADVAALLTFDPASAHEWAGLAARLSDDAHVVLAVAGAAPGRPRRVLAVRTHDGGEEILAEAEIGPGPVRLTLGIRGQDYRLGYAAGEAAARELATVDGRVLDPHDAGAFVGVWLGLYATSNGDPTRSHADVSWFEYLPA